METLFEYLIKSSACIVTFYLLFRLTFRNDKLFTFNRFMLIAILVLSSVIPLIKIYPFIEANISIPVIQEKKTGEPHKRFEEIIIESNNLEIINDALGGVTKTNIAKFKITSIQIITIIYLVGIMFFLLKSLSKLIKIRIILRRTKIYDRKRYKLALINLPISPMSIGHYIIMCVDDYKSHKSEIISHELAHIDFKHTYDLVLLEIIKLFHWFNPFIYLLRRDLKNMHEYQVDEHLIKNGTNSKKYQLLLIKKCVGTERYALANSFNHCQIKNRIIMMNTTKNKKTNMWKLAIFLPLIFIMLFACNKATKNIKAKTTPLQNISESSNFNIEGAWTYVLSKQIKNGNTYTLINEGSKYNEMKIWSKDHFAFVGNQGIGEHAFGGNGKYKIKGNYYEETVINAPLKDGIKPETFKMRIELKMTPCIKSGLLIL